MPRPKPGYETTEFWLTAAVTFAGLILASGVLEVGSPWQRLLALVVSSGAAAGYGWCRTLIKRSCPP